LLSFPYIFPFFQQTARLFGACRFASLIITARFLRWKNGYRIMLIYFSYDYIDTKSF